MGIFKVLRNMFNADGTPNTDFGTVITDLDGYESDYFSVAIQSDGKIGGYKWGVQRKLALLKLEQAMNSK